MHFPYAFLACTLTQGQFNFIFPLHFILRPSGVYFNLQRLTVLISSVYDIWLTEELNRRCHVFRLWPSYKLLYMVKRQLSCLPINIVTDYPLLLAVSHLPRRPR